MCVGGPADFPCSIPVSSSHPRLLPSTHSSFSTSSPSNSHAIMTVSCPTAPMILVHPSPLMPSPQNPRPVLTLTCPVYDRWHRERKTYSRRLQRFRGETLLWQLARFYLGIFLKCQNLSRDSPFRRPRTFPGSFRARYWLLGSRHQNALLGWKTSCPSHWPPGAWQAFRGYLAVSLRGSPHPSPRCSQIRMLSLETCESILHTIKTSR